MRNGYCSLLLFSLVVPRVACAQHPVSLVVTPTVVQVRPDACASVTLTITNTSAESRYLYREVLARAQVNITDVAGHWLFAEAPLPPPPSPKQTNVVLVDKGKSLSSQRRLCASSLPRNASGTNVGTYLVYFTIKGGLFSQAGLKGGDMQIFVVRAGPVRVVVSAGGSAARGGTQLTTRSTGRKPATLVRAGYLKR